MLLCFRAQTLSNIAAISQRQAEKNNMVGVRVLCTKNSETILDS